MRALKSVLEPALARYSYCTPGQVAWIAAVLLAAEKFPTAMLSKVMSAGGEIEQVVVAVTLVVSVVVSCASRAVLGQNEVSGVHHESVILLIVSCDSLP